MKALQWCRGLESKGKCLNPNMGSLASHQKTTVGHNIITKWSKDRLFLSESGIFFHTLYLFWLQSWKEVCKVLIIPGYDFTYRKSSRTYRQNTRTHKWIHRCLKYCVLIKAIAFLYLSRKKGENRKSNLRYGVHSVSVSSKLKYSLLKEIEQPMKFRKVGHSL